MFINEKIRRAFICIGNHMGFKCHLGIFARATGKVIVRAIFMPVVSAIIPELNENTCDHIYTSRHGMVERG